MACLSTEKILYKKDSVQKRFAIPEIALTTTSPPSVKIMLGVIPLVSALKAQSGLGHHWAFQDSKPVQVCYFIASESINTRKRCRSQMNQRTTFRTNTPAIMPLHRPNKAHSLTSQSPFIELAKPLHCKQHLSIFTFRKQSARLT